MAKRLADINDFVQSRASQFRDYLQDLVSDDVWNLVGRLSSETETYVFSGVIRNFFLNRNDAPRDLDLVIEDDLNLRRFLPGSKVKQNSLGGYKFSVKKVSIDIWTLRETWAFRNGQLRLPFDLTSDLPNTTFFNFSSILYSVNHNRFIVGTPFLRFLRDKEIDLVYKENPNPALCIVSSLYYSEKFALRLSCKLYEYICENYHSTKEEFLSVQRKHFQKVLYEESEIWERLTPFICHCEQSQDCPPKQS